MNIPDLVPSKIRKWLFVVAVAILCIFLILHKNYQQVIYPSNQIINCKTYLPKTDPGRVRDEALFEAIYGHNEAEVKNNLVTVDWLPHYFHHKYLILVTRVNNVNVKLETISRQLEQLLRKHPDYVKYLDHPSTYYWRYIQNSNRRSPHSFGIAIDINRDYSNYWIWDTGIKQNNLDQIDVIPYKNFIPCQIVSIFEENGFIWGGKWYHYDTMHFEYRPEFFGIS